MKYSKQEVMQYVLEEDVKFIRIAFCDVFGKQKNISIMPSELKRAFEYGVVIDASSIEGFGGEEHSDLLLHPDPATLTLLPWRPEHGKVVRMMSAVTYPDGTPFEADTRALLKRAIDDAKDMGVSFFIGAEQEFYLFKLDEQGNPTKQPYDNAGYMDIAPEDRGENVRREICLTLESMGITPESSHHEGGPGQNEIDFRYSEPLSAADNSLLFQTVVKTVAWRSGLYADFSPKPLEGKPGNGFHINFSVKHENGECVLNNAIAGVMKHIGEMTAFLNPTDESYERLGKDKTPRYVSWSNENRSQLVRIPAAVGEYRRAELRSPDPATNPYLAFALVIYAALDGIKNGIELMNAADINLYDADKSVLSGFETLPENHGAACELAKSSAFISEHIPKSIVQIYCGK